MKTMSERLWKFSAAAEEGKVVFVQSLKQFLARALPLAIEDKSGRDDLNIRATVSYDFRRNVFDVTVHIDVSGAADTEGCRTVTVSLSLWTLLDVSGRRAMVRATAEDILSYVSLPKKRGRKR